MRGLRKHFLVQRGLLRKTVGEVRAVDGIDLDIFPGQAVGLVGESGCGKTTAGRCILRLLEPTAGTVRFDGVALEGMPPKALRALRRSMQIIFQDPYGSLNPRRSVYQTLSEPLKLHGICSTPAELEAEVTRLLERVGIDPASAGRYPHAFSGGQRQRIGIARALATRPRFIVCDEAVSALDVSVQAQILNLLADLRSELGLSYLFIAHDLAVVRHLCDQVAVMYLGRIVEIGPTEQIFTAPRHPYTRALLEAMPIPDPTRRRERVPLEGDVPTPLNPPSGCAFHPRCPHRVAGCEAAMPQLEPVVAGHSVACSRWTELSPRPAGEAVSGPPHEGL